MSEEKKSNTFFGDLSKRLKAAIAGINDIDLKLLPKILERVAASTFSADGMSAAFTESQKQQLATKLKINPELMQLCVDASVYIFGKAIYNNASSKVFTANLVEIGLKEEVAALFVDLWKASRSDVVTRLADQSLGGPYILKECQWQLGFKTAEANLGVQQETRAIFDFSTVNVDDAEDKSDFTVEFTHPELYQFFRHLDNIQRAIDTAGS
mmetsp:Transcript_9765/g.14280  ORF Transcript_9765/g.14280 Transcript_9765/m.14280 type:complete len:211 (-) Transcript_9765:36-668(-)|eukprot:CAMPEP_0195508798 /NCGR_PEP_ID=MMETSP0794_2-20130614/1918_1 /TAXON_ID=515487 /ORGANISM="Stephanopyxis turris, Strain CCMP 815" /LENGTH=210 /DNA_ID=CAMNT_0040635857 /DNA_START=97 /DNA_END=729 /DNA_ORIENTATION=+